MKAIILEDEHIAAKRIERMILEIYPDMDIVGIYETIEDTADHLISQGQPDILFLDIHVADGNSFELFNVLAIKSKVIFTSAYDQYAIEAFRKNATDYLLKPLKKEQLAEAIEKASKIQTIPSQVNNGLYKNRFLIHFGNKLTSLKTSDIAYIYSKNKISYFYSINGNRYPSNYKLQDLVEQLDPQIYFRANRQFIVSKDSIASMQRHEASRLRLYLVPAIKELIIVSTEKTRKFKEWMSL